MTNAEFDKKLQQQLEELPKAIQPQKDLWKGIDHALEEPVRDSGNGQKWYAIAATVAFVGILSWNLIPQTAPVSTEETLAQMFDPVKTITSEYENQKNVLLVKFENQQPLLEDWQTQLQELEDAKSVVLKALKDDPGNLALLKMLQQVYQQQLDLIESVYAPRWQKV